MCGLVGIYSSNLLMRHKDCLAFLLYLDTWRGKDSTGVAAIRQNADTQTLKATIPGYDFIEGPRLNEHLKLSDFCWIGHNRLGTIGRNIKSNAHPFEILDENGSCILVGAHNGTLKNKHVLDDHARFGTDSEAMFNHIAIHGLEETIKELEGAWALTYYDHLEEELRFIRNKERPLFYAWEEGRKTLIWASEAWMIRIASGRAGIKLEEDKVYTCVEDTLYRFPAPLKMNAELTIERKGGLVGKTPAFFQGFQGGWTGGRHQPQSETATTTRTSAQVPKTKIGDKTTNTEFGTQTSGSGEKPQKKNGSSSNTPPKSEEQDKVTPISRAKKYKGYGGVLYSKTEIEDQLAGGCSWCEEEFICLEDEHGWIAPKKPICSKCMKGELKDFDKPGKLTVH